MNVSYNTHGLKIPSTQTTLSDFDGKKILLSASMLERPLIHIKTGDESVTVDARALIHAILSVHPELFKEPKEQK